MDLDLNIDFRSLNARLELARLFAEMLDADITAPVPDRDDWVGEKKFRELEYMLVQKEQLYQLFADFCDEARKRAKNPDIRVLFRLGIINALRRLPEGERPGEVLMQSLLHGAQEEIDDLPESSRKDRLDSLLSYHGGIYAGVIGDFKAEADFHERSAKIAGSVGDVRGELISHFCGTVARVNHAIVDDPANVAAPLAAMREAGEKACRLLKNMAKDPTTVCWLYLNIPIQMVIVPFWCEESFAGWEKYYCITDAHFYDPNLLGAYRSIIETARAAQYFNSGNFSGAEVTARSVVENRFGSPPSPEYLATAHLILARAALKDSKTAHDVANAHYQNVLKINGSAYQVRAIARRTLGL